MSTTETPVAPSRRRRRKQGNPLLLRIVGIAILVHIIALPILAHFGAFKKVESQFFDTRMVVLAPDKTKPPPKTETKKAPPQKAVHHAASNVPHSHTAPAASHSALAQPKVVAVAGGADNGGGDGGPTVSAGGTGVAGELPGAAKAPAPAPTPAPEPAPQPDPGTGTAGKVIPEPTPMPRPTPAPVPTPEPSPRAPEYTEAEALDHIKPSIPDSLRTDVLDATVIAEFIVSAEGTPASVKITQSSGNPDLDDLALKTARQWRFKPATRDGQPVESTVRLHIEFQVN